MFKKTLPIALTFFISSAQRKGEGPRAFDLSTVPALCAGETFTLTISISAKTTQMPQVDMVKIDLLGLATERRGQSTFYHKEIALPLDIQCLEIPLQADFPVSSMSCGKCSIAYYAVATVRGRGGESTATAKFEYESTYAQRYPVPQLTFVAGDGYAFVLACDNVVLQQGQLLRGRFISGPCAGVQSVQSVRIAVLTSDSEGRLQNLGGVELCDGLASEVVFELPLAGYQLAKTVNWFGVQIQTFACFDIVGRSGAHDYRYVELIIV